MKILICSDGMPDSGGTARLAGLLARPLRAEITLLGIAEKSDDEQSLRSALERQAESLRALGSSPGIVIRSGEPVEQIVDQTAKIKYDLVIIGARRTGSSGSYWRSQKTYEVIKSIEPPVLVAIGDCANLKRILACTGGKEFIEEALQFTGKLAAPIGASVTLLHVMAEPPAMYADLVQLEEDVNLLLESHSELGINLAQQKKDLERVGVSTDVRIRHGNVLDQVFAEFDEGKYDMVVTGSSRTRGMFRHYIMGDLTLGILNRADCPVLVARAGKTVGPRGLLSALRGRRPKPR
ncbi:MAG TPA: universal stress protein [Chthoniobacterales bacterium]|nr:universal stress protein [Chthoniobacterales bacterium]